METILLIIAQPFFFLFFLFIEFKLFLSTNFMNVKDPAVINLLNLLKDCLLVYVRGLNFMFLLRFMLFWFPNINPYVAPYYIVLATTDPLLDRVSSYIPKLFNLDFSYIILTLGLNWLQDYLAKFSF